MNGVGWVSDGSEGVRVDAAAVLDNLTMVLVLAKWLSQ